MTNVLRLSLPLNALPWLAVAFFGALALPSWADKIYLKSGEVLEGTVLDAQETATEYTVEVQLGTIKDRRKIAKADVDRIEKPKPDDIEFEKIKPLVPAPPLLPAADYGKRLQMAEQFLLNFPDTQHKEAAQKIVDELKGELEKVKSGATKLETGWLSEAESKAHKDNIDAMLRHRGILQKAAQGGFVYALRDFADLEANYYGTKAYPDAVESAMKIISAYGGSLTRKKEEVKALQAQEAKQMELISAQQKAQIEAAKAEEKARYDRFLAQEKAAGHKWLTPNPNDEKSLDTAIGELQREYGRLEKMDLAAMREQAEAYYQVESLLAEKKVPEAKAQLLVAQKVKVAGKTTSSKAGYLANLSQRLKDTEEEVKRLAELDKRREAETAAREKELAEAAAKEATQAAPESADSMSTLAALNQMAQQNKPAAAKSPEPEKKTATKPKPKPAPKASSSSSSSSGGGGFNPMVLVYIAAPLLLGVTGLLYYLDKKKKEAAGGA